MILPAPYSWLEKETAPRILLEAIKLYGTKETAGPASNPLIIAWAAELGSPKVGMIYKDDSVAWCGLFMAVCAKRAGLEVPSIPIRAINWLGFGTPVGEALLGDVLVFKRTGGGHVGLYVGEDSECYHVLGGNQSDMVKISRIDKQRLSGRRRTAWKFGQPINVRKVMLAASGDLSHNEA